MVLVTNHIFDRGDIMNKKNCIMATVAAAALTSLSVFMWIKNNPKEAKKMRKDFCKATDDIEDCIENMM